MEQIKKYEVYNGTNGNFYLTDAATGFSRKILPNQKIILSQDVVDSLLTVRGVQNAIKNGELYIKDLPTESLEIFLDSGEQPFFLDDMQIKRLLKVAAAGELEEALQKANESLKARIVEVAKNFKINDPVKLAYIKEYTGKDINSIIAFEEENK